MYICIYDSSLGPALAGWLSVHCNPKKQPAAKLANVLAQAFFQRGGVP